MELRGDPAGQWHTPAVDANEHDALASMQALSDFQGQPAQRSLDAGRIQQSLALHGIGLLARDAARGRGPKPSLVTGAREADGRPAES